MEQQRKVSTLILAAGRGTRMNQSYPKALVSFGGRPMITWGIDAVQSAGLPDPIVVVGYQAERVINEMGPYFQYIYQAEQLGTGHAVRTALREIPSCDDILVLNADHPLISSTTLMRIVQNHQMQGNMITIGTVTVPDFIGWHAVFADFGRIVRNAAGDIEGIVEAKHVNHEQRAINEVNPAYYCFSRIFLEDALRTLSPNPSNGEYYLTDVIAVARAQDSQIGTIPLEHIHEGLGINSPEQLRSVELQFNISALEPNF